jgi:3',5'-cyclic AMP phosphodiesterase CpdA
VSQPLRIAHVTDIHWFEPPSFWDFAPRRLLGSLNLYMLGRRHEFDERVQTELVVHLRETRPDLVLITGDLTAQALPSEFAKAHKALAPLLEEVPTLVIPGNHDMYTPGAVRGRWFEKTFGPWGGTRRASGLVRLDVGPITALGLDPNRPTILHASGYIPDRQLEGLEQELALDEMEGRTIVLGLHYPPIDRHGVLYDDPAHGLRNAAALVKVLDRARHRPCLIACGHVHHGYRRDIALSDGSAVPVLNCGTSGQTHDPGRNRSASAGLYHVLDNQLVAIERFRHDGKRFVLEVGGAFTSGH